MPSTKNFNKLASVLYPFSILDVFWTNERENTSRRAFSRMHIVKLHPSYRISSTDDGAFLRFHRRRPMKNRRLMDQKALESNVSAIEGSMELSWTVGERSWWNQFQRRLNFRRCYRISETLHETLRKFGQVFEASGWLHVGHSTKRKEPTNFNHLAGQSWNFFDTETFDLSHVCIAFYTYTADENEIRTRKLVHMWIKYQPSLICY